MEVQRRDKTSVKNDAQVKNPICRISTVFILFGMLSCAAFLIKNRCASASDFLLGYSALFCSLPKF